LGFKTPEETLRIKSGSCRDFAWLLIHVLRHFGLAARFVSGYIVQLADIKSLDGPSGPEKILPIYMLAEVYLPGAGWIGLDPTSGLCAKGTSIMLHAAL
jgi:transglutaminase-like putative cysteine protease